MAVVRLRAPLSELAGGREHDLEGTTVRELLRALERSCPAVAGWVLDERGHVREHINVYVNAEPAREETAVADGDRVHVLPSITGG
ncbi:MAG: MoaD/ThiS family protein [Thermoleophilia bacterium]|nr:MoaD/ThiS family protein [Thermoleophilia bacterium]MDH5332900.1 MoaD/ThiS family protein [Thermoleophilia bacterium]